MSHARKTIPPEEDMAGYVTMKEAEKLAQKDERTLRRYIKDGLLTKYRSGKRGVLLRKAEVLSLVRPDPTPQAAPPRPSAA